MGHDPDIPSLADPPEGDTTQSQYLHTVFIPVLFPLLPTWMHIASTIVRYVQLFPNTVSYFYSHIHHFNGCRILHHVEITPFPSVTKGSHPACLLYPRLIWFWAFCKGLVERGKTAFRWRVLEKCGHKGQQSCNSHVGDDWANALHGELQSCGKEHISLPFIHSLAMRSHEPRTIQQSPKPLTALDSARPGSESCSTPYTSYSTSQSLFPHKSVVKMNLAKIYKVPGMEQSMH